MRLKFKIRRNECAAGIGTWAEPAGLVAKAVGATSSEGNLVTAKVQFDNKRTELTNYGGPL